ANMAKYLKKHLGVEPYQYKRDYWNNPKFAALRKAIIDNTVEYPEFEGSEHHDILSTTFCLSIFHKAPSKNPKLTDKI
ncbi:hypothetical protein GKC34_14920, partial [Lactobacillus salivarius]|nr:hypothetical protein [Ligilactobacillus salivarius]